MLGFLNLFGKTPFAPMQKHLECVAVCVHHLPLLFQALEEGDQARVESLAAQISEKEHAADLIKNDIRNHLPKSLVLPIPHGSLLEFLAIQDSIADKAEDVAVILTLKKVPLLPEFRNELTLFLQKNIETFDEAASIIHELHELIEFSFGGIEAERVNSMVEKVAFKEHEVDLIQRQLLKKFFTIETGLSLSTFHMWQKIFEALADISNLSEKLANRVRMTLELK